MTIFVSDKSHPFLEGVMNEVSTFKKRLKTIQQNPESVKSVCSTIFCLKTDYAELKGFTEDRSMKQLSYFQRKKIQNSISKVEKLYRKVIRKLEKLPVIEKAAESLDLDTMIEQENAFAFLPNEVKYIVFSQLNVYEIAKIMTVCKEWYQFLQDTLFTKTFTKKFVGEYPLHIIEPVDRTKYCFLYLKVDQMIARYQLSHCIALGEYDPSFISTIICCGTDRDLDDYLKYSEQTVDDVHREFKFKKKVYGSPLHYAVFCCQYEAVKALLKHNADVNQSDKDEFTPLMLICSVRGNEALKMVKLLIEHGADIHATLSDGRNALDIARSVGNDKIAKCLEDNGAVSSMNDDIEDIVIDVIDEALDFVFGS